MVGGDGTVTIEVAAELMNVEVRAIREWAAIGSLEIERRGDEEAVHLGQVKTLARSPLGSQGGESRRGTLRGLLRDAKTDTESIAGLQELARERIATEN
jgi:phage terminase Nu1 subunit (DNA packaging protein)